MESSHHRQSPRSRGLCDTTERNACVASDRDTEEAVRKDHDVTLARTINHCMIEKYTVRLIIMGLISGYTRECDVVSDTSIEFVSSSKSSSRSQLQSSSFTLNYLRNRSS